MTLPFKSLLLAVSLLPFSASLSAADHNHDAQAAAPHTSTNLLAPGDAMRRLLDGNQRFVAGQTTHPNQSAERRKTVAAGQNPIAVILTCADSRVSPELIFDQGLGDLFVIRNAGNVLDDHVLGSIEYAVEHLHAPLVIVLGHSSCGAAKATLQGGEVPGHVRSIVDSIQPALDESRTKPGNKLDNLILGHAEATAFKITKSEPILDAAIAKGHLRVVGGRYDLETGKVELIKPAVPYVHVSK